MYNLDDINILTNMVTSLFKVYVKTKFDDEAAKVAIDEISKKLKQLQKNNG